MKNIEKVATVAAVACCGYLVLTNLDSLKKIGSKVNGGISSALDKVAENTEAAPKE